MKVCNECNLEFPDDRFEKKRAKCKTCRQIYREKRRSKERELIIEYKKENSVCEYCGFDDWRAIQYHHRNPEEKEFEIADGINKGRKFEKVLEEIKKCDSICANCHQILHFKKYGY